MQIKCLHGYFKFIEDRVGEIAKFCQLTDFDLVLKDDYYTFSSLADAADYSVAGSTYLDIPTTKTFEGQPWEVMRENGIAYDFAADIALPIETVVAMCEIQAADNYFISNGLILPGSITDDGSRVTDYVAWFYFDSMRFKYTEVLFE